MLQQDQGSDVEAGAKTATSIGGLPGRRARPSNDCALSAMDAGLERLAARAPHPARLLPFRFMIGKSDSGEAIVAGTTFASSAALVRSHARLAASQALQVLCHTQHDRRQASFDDCRVGVEMRSMPVAAPPRFALRNEDWNTYAAELIVRGAPFFPEAVEGVRSRVVAARRPLHEAMASSYVQQILAMDPEVRRARAARQDVSWRFLSGYLPGKRSAARVAIHVAADDVAVALSPVTSMAVLCILLRVSNYNRKTGMIGHQDGGFTMPASAVLRAAAAASQLKADDRRAEGAEDALRYLQRIGLHALAQGVAAQAVAAVQARTP